MSSTDRAPEAVLSSAISAGGLSEKKADYKWPRAWASLAMRAASALRSDSFFLTQASQDFPEAVSSPVKAIATMSAYGIFISPGCPLGKSCRNGGEANALRLKIPLDLPCGEQLQRHIATVVEGELHRFSQ